MAVGHGESPVYGSRLYALGHPVVFVNQRIIDDKRKFEKESNPLEYALAHELTHVEQSLSAPVRSMRRTGNDSIANWDIIGEAGAYAMEFSLLNLRNQYQINPFWLKSLKHTFKPSDFKVIGCGDAPKVYELSELAPDLYDSEIRKIKEKYGEDSPTAQRFTAKDS